MKERMLGDRRIGGAMNQALRRHSLLLGPWFVMAAALGGLAIAAPARAQQLVYKPPSDPALPQAGFFLGPWRQLQFGELRHSKRLCRRDVRCLSRWRIGLHRIGFGTCQYLYGVRIYLCPCSASGLLPKIYRQQLALGSQVFIQLFKCNFYGHKCAFALDGNDDPRGGLSHDIYRNGRCQDLPNQYRASDCFNSLDWAFV